MYNSHLVLLIAILLLAIILHLECEASILDVLKDIHDRLFTTRCWYKVTDKYRLNCIKYTDKRVW